MIEIVGARCAFNRGLKNAMAFSAMRIVAILSQLLQPSEIAVIDLQSLRLLK